MDREDKFNLLFAIYLTSMIMVNIIGSKVCTICGIRVSVAILLMPLMFLVSDIITECYGRKKANDVVKISLLMLIIVFFTIWVSIKMPPNEKWGFQKEYEIIFKSNLRMIAASVASFFISEMLNIVLFTKLKTATSGKFLYIRNNISTILSQAADTLIFMFLAFYKMNEKYTVSFVLHLALPYWVIKIVLALLDTPFCYFGVYLIDGKIKEK